MTGELMHTASKERMVPKVMFSTEHVAQISIADSKMKWLLHFAFNSVCSAHYTALQTNNR